MRAAVKRAIKYNKRAHKRDSTVVIQRIVGADPDGIWGPQTVLEVMEWQKAHGLEVDGKVGPNTWRLLVQNVEVEERPLTVQEIDEIIEHTIKIESNGADNPYAASNLDAEYLGWFDRPKRDENGKFLRPSERAKRADHRPHWASKYRDDSPGTHIGRSEGFIQFTQLGGALGKVLHRFWDYTHSSSYPEHHGDFEEIFPHHDELLRVVGGRRGTSQPRKGLGPGKRSLRCLPVGGHDIWKAYWEKFFEKAADHPLYQKAQRDIAAVDYFTKGVELCIYYGFSTQAELAVAFDACVQHGSGGSPQSWEKRFREDGDEPRKGAIARFWRAHKKHGDAMTIQHVMAEFGALEKRRLKVYTHADPWVNYTNLDDFEFELEQL